MPHRGSSDNENFLDDAVREGEALYHFHFDEGKKMQWFDGNIYVYGNRASISIWYDSIALRRPDLNHHLEEIAAATGVQTIFTVENKIIETEGSGLGFVNVPIFRENGNLTVGEFLRDHVFKLSQAAKQASEIEKRAMPRRYT